MSLRNSHKTVGNDTQILERALHDIAVLRGDLKTISDHFMHMSSAIQRLQKAVHNLQHKEQAE